MAALNSNCLSGRIDIRTPRTKVEHGLLIPRTSSKLVASSLSSVKAELKNSGCKGLTFTVKSR